MGQILKVDLHDIFILSPRLPVRGLALAAAIHGAQAGGAAFQGVAIRFGPAGAARRRALRL